MLPDKMRAVEISAPGGPEVLRCVERPVPQPGCGEVLLKIAFAGVNRPDALQRAGLYAPPPNASDLPGLEAAGEIVALGEGVSGVQSGDQVCALLPGGGYAEYAIVPQAHCLPIPRGHSLANAACIPETFFTVYSNVFERGCLQAGERFLVHGGSSGIGTTAIQLARLAGARVFATAGSSEKCEACLTLGAERAVNYRSEDFVPIMRAEGGMNLILDMVGGEYIKRNIKALRNDGRLVNIAFLNGSRAEINFAEIMMRRLTLTGSTLRPQSNAAKADIARALHKNIWPLLESQRVAPVIDTCYEIENAEQAHRHMESSTHIGKIVLRVDPNAPM